MLFAEAAAMKVGVSFRSVGTGIATYPVTTGGPVGIQRQRAEAVAAVTLGVTVHELKPTRMATHLVYSIEDTARLPGLADAIRREMSDALVDSLDKAIFLGATAGGTEADIKGLTSATGVFEETLTQANKVKGTNTLEAFVDQVDGKYASGPGDLRIVAAQGANKLWSTTIVAAAVSNQTIAGFLRENGINWSVRGDIESNTANNDYGAFFGKSPGHRRRGCSGNVGERLACDGPLHQRREGRNRAHHEHPLELRSRATGQLQAPEIRELAWRACLSAGQRARVRRNERGRFWRKPQDLPS